MTSHFLGEDFQCHLESQHKMQMTNHYPLTFESFEIVASAIKGLICHWNEWQIGLLYQSRYDKMETYSRPAWLCHSGLKCHICWTTHFSGRYDTLGPRRWLMVFCFHNTEKVTQPRTYVIIAGTSAGWDRVSICSLVFYTRSVTHWNRGSSNLNILGLLFTPARST